MALANLIVNALNDPRTPGTTRRPRCRVAVNGIPLTGVVSAEVTASAHFSAGTYRVEAAVSGLPTGFGADYWSSSAYDRVAISAGYEDDFGGQTLEHLITGQVDDVEYDVVRRKLVLSGRDLSGALIDAKTAEKFVNLRAHEIAQQLALRHGLDSDVQATATLAGKYYQIDHSTLTREQSEWDLLCYLAEREGYDVWVGGETLFFKPQPAETAPAYVLLWSQTGGSNCESLTLSRSQTLAGDVVVRVRSWNQAQEKAFTVTYKASPRGKKKDDKPQVYSYTVANLSRDQALQYAQKMAEQVTRHERVLSASLPGDNVLSARSPVRLLGTGTDWDQTYYPETVTRRLSFEEGYRMELKAKNHSPQDTVIV